jgi:hypothetical protein
VLYGQHEIEAAKLLFGERDFLFQVFNCDELMRPDRMSGQGGNP